MVEVKSLKNFTDKETGVFHKVGDSFSCEGKRAEELADKKVVLILTKEEAPKEKPKRSVKKKG